MITTLPAMLKTRLASNWGWVVVSMSWILYLVMLGIMYSYGILFVEFQAEFKSSATFTGWAGAIPLALSILLAPPMQVIINHFSYRPVAVVSLVLSSAGIVATSFVPNMFLVYVTYSLVYGCGAAGAFLVTLDLIVQYFPTQNCVRALAVALSGSSIGMLSFAPFLKFLIDRFGWRNTLRIMGSLYFTLGIPCVASFVPSSQGLTASSVSTSDRTPSQTDHQRDGQYCKTDAIHTSTDECVNADAYQDSSRQHLTGHCIDEQPGSIEQYREKVYLDEDTLGNIPKDIPGDTPKEILPSSSQHSMDDVKTSLRQRLCQAMTYPELWFISLAVIINGLADCFYYVNMVSYIVSVGFTETDGARFLSVLGASTAVGKLSLSLVGELLPFPSYYIMLIASLVSCVVMCCFLFVRNLAPMLFLAAVIGGVMMSTTGVVTYSIPNTFFGTERSHQTWPVILFCNGVGFMCGSVVGQSIDRTGSYRSAIWTFIGMYIIVSVLWIAAPLYQRTFAPKRYVLQELHRVKRLSKKKVGVGLEGASEKLADISKLSGTKLEVVYERVSSV